MFTDRLKALLGFKRQVEDTAAQALAQATAARARATAAAVQGPGQTAEEAGSA